MDTFSIIFVTIIVGAAIVVVIGLRLHDIKEILINMATDQEKLDALVASEETEIAALGASAVKIADEIAALKAAAAANQPLDFSKAEAALADLTGAATSVAGLEPPPPAEPTA